MAVKTLPFTKKQIEKIIEKFPTPFHLYDEKAIRENARDFKQSFSWNKGFKEFFAVKAAPNPYLMKILSKEGFGADCSSLPELLLAEKTGITGEEIMFSSNDTPAEEFVKARQMGAIINLDDISHIGFLETHAGLPELICMRYNPGPLKKGNVIIGHPEEAKYGFTREQLFAGYKICRDKGVRRFGIHAMVASNELDANYFVETAQILFELVAEISRKLKIRFEFVNLSGGVGIPYLPQQERIDLAAMSRGVKSKYEEIIVAGGVGPLKIFTECGRYITGPYGYLVSRILHIKDTYKKFAGLDASMANLMRPAIYGAYHHITVMGKENMPHNIAYDVTGSLCENNDKFAIDRLLPVLEPGDIVVIHDTGAHGHAMGFNYNGKLRSAELLLRDDGSVVQIRRAETVDDYFATLDFAGLAKFKA
ncbi:MAG TPA: diaminopimelate decarboxylase [Smithellaceae bacterium]|nr:diaminopimelate decarboxylase [Smithellaceae bacterium]HRS89452.1 diaminopimelate decarboxylase [Smithellaceae bacterium]HRV26401.1 diaminopimelate decarboxylase [Smithellaceae bacterium]